MLHLSGSGEASGCCDIGIRVGGACSPPPPVAAPLVPRCALLSGATPREGCFARPRTAERFFAREPSLPSSVATPAWGVLRTAQSGKAPPFGPRPTVRPTRRSARLAGGCLLGAKRSSVAKDPSSPGKGSCSAKPGFWGERRRRYWEGSLRKEAVLAKRDVVLREGSSQSNAGRWGERGRRLVGRCPLK